MAKVRHGKRIYTPRQAEVALEAATDRANSLQLQLEFAKAWARAQLDIHQPYVSGRVDVSCSSIENLKENFTERLSRNIYCANCSTPWPCRAIEPLRLLRSAVASSADLEESYMSLDSMVPPERKSAIETAI